ncbi:DUF1553 domain-containing protein [Roseibacillus ishigakijimensis]|uniref:DUF1553 domain-containing protein n=1 Tax=Roseibacillus ishigakijimensis TaxID=454146 RepID=A0A934RTA1_9BACT|nr:DUF1553 domain-containing protein [Roseibacillus ishigakijimensis]MBK1834654.1 DUF1553 domain-containing protein [Roseibacillus ishigakijimensis]
MSPLTQGGLCQRHRACLALPVRWLPLLFLLLLSSCQEKDPWAGDPSVPVKISFNQHLRPLFTRECLSCHRGEDAQGGFSLDRAVDVAGLTTENSPRKSLLWEKISDGHPRPLPEQEQALIWRWIKQGAETESHWASLPLSEPTGAILPPSLPPTEEVDGEELAFLTRSLFGREPTPEEESYLARNQPPRGLLIETMMRQPAFARFFKSRLLLLSGTAPVSSKGPFAPYLRWLDNDLARPDFALDDFLRRALGGDLLAEGGEEGTLASAWVRLPHRAGVTTLAERVATSFLALNPGEEPCDGDLWADAGLVLGAYLPDFPTALEEGPLQSPLLPLYTAAGHQQMGQASARERDLWEQAEIVPSSVDEGFPGWLALGDAPATIPDLLHSFSFDESAPRDHSPTGGARLLLTPALAGGVQGTAMVGPAVFSHLPLTSDRAFTLSFFIKASHLPDKEENLLWLQGPTHRPDGFQLSLSPHSLRLAFVSEENDATLAASASVLPQPAHWHHLALTYDGSRRAEGLGLWIDARPIELTVEEDRLFGVLGGPENIVKLRYPAPPEGQEPTLFDELQIYGEVLSAIEIAHLRDGQSLWQEIRAEHPREDLLYRYYQRAIDPDSRQARQAAVAASRAVAQLQEQALLVPVAEATPPPALRPPLPFLSLAVTAEANRLGLADWLVDPRNPVTPRVLASRLYQMIHGIALLPGDDISDPWQVPARAELLDHLARELVNQEWNLRAILRLILLHPPQESGELLSAS